MKARHERENAVMEKVLAAYPHIPRDLARHIGQFNSSPSKLAAFDDAALDTNVGGAASRAAKAEGHARSLRAILDAWRGGPRPDPAAREVTAAEAKRLQDRLHATLRRGNRRQP